MSPAADRGQWPGAEDGLLTYGLVARIALGQPGFGFRMEHDLPPGVELVESRPRAKVIGDHLIWQFGRVDPGQQIRLEIVVRPEPGTTLNPNDVATFTGTYSQNLYFQAPVVRPRLNARISGPATTEVGQSVEFVLDVANFGSWIAEKVQASVTLPPGLAHPDGPVFAFNLGAIKPGEFRRVIVPARAVACGDTVVRASVTGTDDRQAVVEFPTEVVEPSE